MLDFPQTSRNAEFCDDVVPDALSGCLLGCLAALLLCGVADEAFPGSNDSSGSSRLRRAPHFFQALADANGFTAAHFHRLLWPLQVLELVLNRAFSSDPR